MSITPTRASSEKPQVEEEPLASRIDQPEKNCFDDQISIQDIGPKKDNPIYELVMKDKARVDSLMIFDKLCSKEDYKKNK